MIIRVKNITFNFCLFRFWHSCGNYKVNYYQIAKFLSYSINKDLDTQNKIIAIQCSKCNKATVTKLIIRKINDEFYIENGGVK